MKYYMLDTNTISYLMKEHPKVSQHIVSIPMSSVCISSITEGELLFGLAKRPDAKRLHKAVRELLLRIDVLPWNSSTAQKYGQVRADTEKKGKLLGTLDMLIAAHAIEVGAILVTNDKAFKQITKLHVEDWTL